MGVYVDLHHIFENLPPSHQGGAVGNAIMRFYAITKWVLINVPAVGRPKESEETLNQATGEATSLPATSSEHTDAPSQHDPTPWLETFLCGGSRRAEHASAAEMSWSCFFPRIQPSVTP